MPCQLARHVGDVGMRCCSGRNATIGERTGDIKIRREVESAESGSGRQKDDGDKLCRPGNARFARIFLSFCVSLARLSHLALDWNACMPGWSLDLVRLANTKKGNGCFFLGVEKQPVVDELAIIARPSGGR